MPGPDTPWTETATREAVPGPDCAIPVLIACRAAGPRGTVLLIHGRDGAPDQVQIAEIALAYLARGWRVVAPELPFSAALPHLGPRERLTMANHLAAAAAVRDWAVARFPGERLALAGHSLGGYAGARLAGEGLHHLLAVSPVLSGRMLLAARIAMGPDAVAVMEREAPQFRAEMEAEDAAPDLARLEAPVAVVTGSADGIVPLAHAQRYFATAPNARFFAALPDVHHCPAGPECAAALAMALSLLQA
ncbi:alpha/beta fold hydrolase [Tropicimonas sp. IMCC34043]|uniref:alpha/beta fold hydrolase n=1 Tax=Tropicimonas sp. IMCC34043 TaxID=2248760 RepID=UPI000E22F71D|nr:alpha/beta hydrolase [Tropicimonas sp. IMCC34043]